MPTLLGWSLVQFNNLTFGLHTPPGYVEIGVGSAVVHHELSQISQCSLSPYLTGHEMAHHTALQLKEKHPALLLHGCWWLLTPLGG